MKILEKIDKYLNEEVRPISEIAREIARDWKNVNYAAKPYLSAMYSLNSMKDDYGMDSAEMIVAYYLSNATTWRGETAKRIKAELKQRLKIHESVNEENGYIAFFKGQQIEIYASGIFQAKEKALAEFKKKYPKIKDFHMLHVHLAEKDGKAVVHTPDF